MSERLQKLLARHGLGSRRQIEDWILAGRILLNGVPARLGDRFTPGDRLILDGKDVTAKLAVEAPARVIAYHKPPGENLRADAEGEQSVFDRLPAIRGARWLAINPLSGNDSGLLLFSTDGRLVNALKRRSPATPAVYMVRVLAPGREAGVLPDIAPRVVHDDREVEFSSVEPAGGEGSNLWYRVTAAHADRRAAVRALFEAQGLTVSRLIQVGYGDVELSRDLPRGRHRELPADAVASLYASAGLQPPPVPARTRGRTQPRARSTPARRRRSGR